MGTKIQTGYDEVPEFGSVVPKGTYTARLNDVEETESNKGNPMLVWDFELLDGVPGASVRGWTSLLEHALGSAREYFTAFNKSWEPGDDLERLARRFIRKGKVKLIVGIRTYRDRESGEEKENNSIVSVLRIGKPAAGKKATKAKKKADPEGGTDTEEDDIPF